MSFTTTFPGFSLRLTRWGLVYLGACIILGLAAVNTGNNALMALLGIALGSYIVSGTWSRQVLAKVRLEVEMPREVYAGREAVIGVRLTNPSRLFPAYGLIVRDSTGRIVVREPLLATDHERHHSVSVEFQRRGWQAVGPWWLDVLLPLGFFVKSKELASRHQVLVFPRLLPISQGGAHRGGGRRGAEGLKDRGREGEVTQLRDYRDGDDVRQMHWKQTARQQRAVVVDRQRASEEPVFLVVDPRLADRDNPRQRERFEHMISEVATAAMHRLRDGDPVGLVIGGDVVPPVRSLRHAATLLRPLAEVAPVARVGPSPMLCTNRRSLVFAVNGEPR